MTSKKVKVVKVPLPNDIKNKQFYTKAFPKMPILYLELLENKAKVKQEFVNKEYVPKIPEDNNETDNETIKEDFDEDPSPPKSQPETPSHKDEESGYSEVETDTEKSPVKRSNYSHSSSSSSSSPKVKKDNKDKKISNRLKELLGDSDGENNNNTEYFSPEQKKQSYNAPSLKELESNGKFVRKKEVEDIGHTTVNEQEQEDLKRELLFKFELLKKSYKSENIPEFSIHSDYETMKKSYENTLRTLSLDKSVEDYKKYLIGGFMLMEFVCGNWLGFDMQGFTQQQIVSMNSYERLLIELGEKSYVPSGSKWPVEVRLLFLIIMNAAFFIISKMILKKTGSNLMGMINNMNVTQNPSILKKRKMKGPSVNVDDIPDVAE